jgi:hypothetical protein
MVIAIQQALLTDSLRHCAVWFLGMLLFAAAEGCSDGAASLGATAPLAAFSGLGRLPGDHESQATAISDDGVVVVGISKSFSGK